MPRDEPSREDIIEWLRRAADHAQHAEIYHEVAANPRSIEGPSARQAESDAAVMQLVELIGPLEERYALGHGDAGTTLARFDDALSRLLRLRTAHVHPETHPAPPPVTPRYMTTLTASLTSALGNLDADSLKMLRPTEYEALRGLRDRLVQFQKDRPPDAEALRPRDLHYAGYLHEIQFARLAKATVLFDTHGKSDDPRLNDINACIFDADHFAHKFGEMRRGADASVLPVSVVSPKHRLRVPDRTLSELVREQRSEFQTHAERLKEMQAARPVDALAQQRNAADDVARTYAEITGEAKAVTSVHDYLRHKQPQLEAEEMTAMAEALRVAAARDGTYLKLPEAVRDECTRLCLALDQQSDPRLLEILNAAEERAQELGTQQQANLGFAERYGLPPTSEPIVSREHGPEPDEELEL
jgi:hypothetical protein